jgi:sulfide:quinone oxidoreductase
MSARVLVLGAGFGGLELTTILSEAFGDGADVTLIDKSDSFVFGYAKLDVLFGHETPEAVRLPYREFVKPGVEFLQETVVAIDPALKQVTTDRGVYEADYLVVALGADYDVDATPGLADATEFYSVAGAERMREILPTFSGGRAVIGVCGAPFKCPPAPSEAALLLHDYLTARGIREDCAIDIVLPFGIPVPPSPETSEALIGAFAEREIRFVANSRVSAVDTGRGIAILGDGSELSYDLFLGVPKHRAPDVVIASGLAEDDWVPVDPTTLETRFPGVYSVGDVANQGTPKAGVFAEGAAKTVAASLIAAIRHDGEPVPHTGTGSCYIEFGAGRVGRVDVDFFSGPSPTGVFHAPSADLRAQKDHFGSSRRRRWFDR